jgi:hypothetical protein
LPLPDPITVCLLILESRLDGIFLPFFGKSRNSAKPVVFFLVFPVGAETLPLQFSRAQGAMSHVTVLLRFRSSHPQMKGRFFWQWGQFNTRQNFMLQGVWVAGEVKQETT